MSFLFRHEQVKEFETRVIIRQVVEGLNFLHTQGIVHRDLKPENVLLAYSPRVAYHRVLLADFGASALPGRNRMVTVIGTRDYQAPYVTNAACPSVCTKVVANHPVENVSADANTTRLPQTSGLLGSSPRCS